MAEITPPPEARPDDKYTVGGNTVMYTVELRKWDELVAELRELQERLDEITSKVIVLYEAVR